MGLKGCLQRVMAAGKAIMNLMAGQSVPTCVPASLKWTDLTLSVWFLPCICHGDDDLTGQPGHPEMKLQQPISCLHFPLLPKDNRKEMKERGCFLFSCIFYTIYFACLPILLSPSFSLPLPLTYVYKHTL